MRLNLLAVGLLMCLATTLHASEKLPDDARWPKIWKMFRSIRDSTRSAVDGAGLAVTSSTGGVTRGVRDVLSALKTKAGIHPQQDIDKVATAISSARSSAETSWHSFLDKSRGALAHMKSNGFSLFRNGPGPEREDTDYEKTYKEEKAATRRKSSKENDSLVSREALLDRYKRGKGLSFSFKWPPRTPVEENSSDVEEPDRDASNKTAEELPFGLVNSALERVKGAAQTIGEVGRAVGMAVGTSVGRFGKAMAGTVVTAAQAVNRAVGNVAQAITNDADESCFEDLGCFSLREPWVAIHRPLPRMNTPEQIQTKFFLWNRNLTEAEEIPLVANASLAHSSFDPDKRTFFIVHGFNDESDSAWVHNMKDALLEKADTNVVLVDWSRGAYATKSYLQTAHNTRVVGAQLGRLLKQLSKERGLPLDVVHIVGHSLGAHIAGYAGKALDGQVGRITALDAAQPVFEDQVPEVRVASTDAHFVDAIHTNGVPFFPAFGLGMMQPVGDVDFYVNFGTVQPGCFTPKLPTVHSWTDLAMLPVSVLSDMLGCSHKRSIEYFIEAIRSDCRMWGLKMEDNSTSNVMDDLEGATELPSVHAARLTSSSPSWSKIQPSAPDFPALPLLSSIYSDGRTTTDAPFPTTPAPQNHDAHERRDKPDVDAPAASGRSGLALEPAWCAEQCVPLGLDSAFYGLTGSFAVRTSSQPPYCCKCDPCDYGGWM